MLRGLLPALFTALLIVLFSLEQWATAPAPFRLLFASDRDGNGDIFTLNQHGTVTNLTKHPAGDWDPHWSPGGQTILFTSHRSGNSDIWLMQADGSNPRNLSNHPAWDFSPAWSPDGREFVFVSERDGDAELFRQSLNGGNAVQLTHNEHPDKAPVWSPDGKTLAYAAIVQGRERLFRLSVDNGHSEPLLDNLDLSGTAPAWSPNGETIAFVGWQSPAAISIYSYNLDNGTLQTHHTDTAWLGSLSWSTTGAWLFFTARRDQQHDVMALNMSTGKVIPLTANRAWDDFAGLQPNTSLNPNAITTGEPAPQSPTVSHLHRGVNLADLGNAYLVQDLGFKGIKGYVNWATVEPEPGVYRWTDPDNILAAAAGANAQVLLRVQGAPVWARPPDTTETHPPTNPADFAAFLTVLATRYQGQVLAYEIWNEPNLNYEWGYQTPNPAAYTALLQAAYPALKTADPAALVLAGGLSPAGDGNPPETFGDLYYLEQMYRAGAKGHFDALAVHVYTYGQAPDYNAPGELTFDRVRQQHDIMLAHLDDNTPVWITEMGWNIETHWDLGEFHNQRVSQAAQANYLVRAYEKIETEWPWVDAAYLFNLDFSLAPWYPAAEQMRWYAILNPDRTPRPAFSAISQDK